MEITEEDFMNYYNMAFQMCPFFYHKSQIEYLKNQIQSEKFLGKVKNKQGEKLEIFELLSKFSL